MLSTASTRVSFESPPFEAAYAPICGKPKKAGIRSNVHDRAAFVWDHRPNRFTGVKEGAGEIDRQCVVPFLQREIQNAGVFDGCGVVYENVEPSESFERQGNDTLGGILTRDIANKRQYASIGAREFFHFWIDIFANDLRIACCEEQGGSAADAARSASHDRYFKVGLRILRLLSWFGFRDRVLSPSDSLRSVAI
jgi:hypothetical protein